MSRGLQTFDRAASFADMMRGLDQDGGIIVRDFIDAPLVARLNAELDAAISDTPAGAPEIGPFMAQFWGKQTKRFTRLAALAPSFAEVLDHELMHAWAGHDLEGGYWLNTGQAMIIGPGQPAQYLHRDIALWPLFNTMGPKAPDCMVSIMLALNDFTEETGATRVIPGSHRWEDFGQAGEESQTVGAVMSAGSALLYKGKTMHGAGANSTTDRWRRGVHMSFILGWLTPEEANPIGVPWSVAKDYSPRVQRMLGYASRPIAEDPGSCIQWLIDFDDVAKFVRSTS